jgi:hypothetical protein
LLDKKSKYFYGARKIWSDLRVVLREEFMASEITIREKILIFGKYSTLVKANSNSILIQYKNILLPYIFAGLVLIPIDIVPNRCVRR